MRKKRRERKIQLEKIKGIKSKIQISIVSSVLVVSVVLSLGASYFNYKTAMDTVEITLNEITETAAKLVESRIAEIRILAEDIGQLANLADESVSVENKALLFNYKIEQYGLLDAYLADEQGHALTTVGKESISVLDTDYYKASIAGETFVSNPIYNSNGGMYFVVSAPLISHDANGSSTKGVIILEVDGKVLTDIVSQIEVGEGGFGVIVDKNANKIAHPIYENVINKENAIELAKSDHGYRSLGAIEEKMMNGEVDHGNYTFKGVKKLISYAPIEDTNGWSLMVNTPRSHYMDNTILSMIFTGLLVIASVVVTLFIGKVIANKIASPIIASAERLKLLAEGDLQSDVPTVTSNDETGILVSSLEKTVKQLRNIISDISYHLGSIANKDYTTVVDAEYAGDLNVIKESLTKLIDYNNYQISQISESAEQIASGSEQVAAGAQILSQGSTEQASSVEELSATINEITEQIKSTAEIAERIRLVSLDVGNEIIIGNQKVDEMNFAMNEITNSSQEIAKIIKVIDDIAFQTNILALNAAVEAARAGSAGKGFAVVADEVRNLASKSAEAAQNTTFLIENSLKTVANGVKIAERTKESLSNINDKANRAIEGIAEVSLACEQQALGASQISVGIEQISSVVHTNSATSEESAAASEELSSQAMVLKGLINGIKLRERNNFSIKNS